MEAFSKLIKNKNVINIAILGILAIIMVVVIYIVYFSHSPPPEGALRVVKCTGCGEKSVNLIMDINDSHDPKCICVKCGKPLGYAFKCDVCDFEYPVIPLDKQVAVEISKMKTMGKFKYVLQTRKCTNCSATSTNPMSVEKK